MKRLEREFRFDSFRAAVGFAVQAGMVADHFAPSIRAHGTNRRKMISFASCTSSGTTYVRDTTLALAARTAAG